MLSLIVHYGLCKINALKWKASITILYMKFTISLNYVICFSISPINAPNIMRGEREREREKNGTEQSTKENCVDFFKPKKMGKIGRKQCVYNLKIYHELLNALSKFSSVFSFHFHRVCMRAYIQFILNEKYFTC